MIKCHREELNHQLMLTQFYTLLQSVKINSNVRICSLLILYFLKSKQAENDQTFREMTAAQSESATGLFL